MQQWCLAHKLLKSACNSDSPPTNHRKVRAIVVSRPQIIKECVQQGFIAHKLLKSACWEVLKIIYRLFRESSMEVAKKLGLSYPVYDKNISNYIKDLQNKYTQ